MNNKVDLSDLSNLKAIDELTNADITDINGDNCETEGSYKITATLEEEKNLDGKYPNVELRFSAPEATGLCLLTIQGKNVYMTCENKDKFYSSNIYIEKQLIKDEDGKALFFMNWFTSTNQLQCDISLKTWASSNVSSQTEPDSTEDKDNNNEDNIRYNKKSDGGLTGGAIAGIAIS